MTRREVSCQFSTFADRRISLSLEPKGSGNKYITCYKMIKYVQLQHGYTSHANITQNHIDCRLKRCSCAYVPASNYAPQRVEASRFGDSRSIHSRKISRCRTYRRNGASHRSKTKTFGSPIPSHRHTSVMFAICFGRPKDAQQVERP